jgi:hypothetical protein
VAKYGVNLFAAHVDLWLGRPMVAEPVARPGCVGMTHLNTKPGVLLEHPSAEEIMAMPGVVHAKLQYPRGWSIRSSRDGVNYRIGTIVVACIEKQDTQARMRDVADCFHRGLRVGPAKPNIRRLPWAPCARY